MSSANEILIPRAAFADLALLRTRDGGVVATERDELALAIVMARRGKTQALADRVREQLHVELPEGPRRAVNGELAFAGIGPGMWLATRDKGINAFSRELRGLLSDVAAVSDQSDAYAVLSLAGFNVREILAKLVSIDLHSRAFSTGDIAVTMAGHLALTVWRLEDQANGSPIFELAVPRSFAESFAHALCAGVAPLG